MSTESGQAQTLLNAIREGLSQQVAREAAQAVLKSSQEELERNLLLVRQYFGASQLRLQQEVSALSRRGNLNLVVGGATTFIAVGLLVFLLVANPADPRLSIAEQSLHYLPRLSIAIFIEFFSFFFLRLYRAGLEEIKFFQNELTNVETKYAALEAAMARGEGDLARRVVLVLAKTERNFVLRKGETTVDLQRLKIEGSTAHEIGKVVSAALQGLAKTKGGG